MIDIIQNYYSICSSKLTNLKSGFLKATFTYEKCGWQYIYILNIIVKKTDIIKSQLYVIFTFIYIFPC